MVLDFLIVGGGIVGLSIGRELLIRNPSLRVAVIEKDVRPGMHASSRNSGVLHAGFYYSPDSLKAKLTRRGNQLLTSFIHLNDLPFRPTGKVVVAKSSEEIPALEELHSRGLKNGVEVDLVSESELKRLEPLANTFKVALWSPNTSSADPVAVLEAISKEFVSRGGSLLLEQRLIEVSDRTAVTNSGKLEFGHLINTAGLYADKVAELAGVSHDYKMLPFKGLYLLAPELKGVLKRHIYPVPDSLNPFLGTHFTVRHDGVPKVGPTAIPALWREDYGRGFSNFQLNELMSIVSGLPQFLRAQNNVSRKIVGREVMKYWSSYLLKEASKLAPKIMISRFKLRGEPGVRAQLMHRGTGKLEMDFVISENEWSTHLLNTVSPGWTSALAIAEEICNRLSPIVED